MRSVDRRRQHTLIVREHQSCACKRPHLFAKLGVCLAGSITPPVPSGLASKPHASEQRSRSPVLVSSLSPYHNALLRELDATRLSNTNAPPPHAEGVTASSRGCASTPGKPHTTAGRWHHPPRANRRGFASLMRSLHPLQHHAPSAECDGTSTTPFGGRQLPPRRSRHDLTLTLAHDAQHRQRFTSNSEAKPYEPAMMA
jgi:hypothetical protein